MSEYRNVWLCNAMYIYAVPLFALSSPMVQGLNSPLVLRLLFAC
jgi:hypothetical protein